MSETTYIKQLTTFIIAEAGDSLSFLGRFEEGQLTLAIVDKHANLIYLYNQVDYAQAKAHFMKLAGLNL